MYLLTRFYFKKGFVDEVQGTHPDFIKDYCEIVRKYGRDTKVTEGNVETIFKEKAYDENMLLIGEEVKDVFGVDDPWEYISVEMNPLTTIRIVPDESWVEELERKSFFIFELADALRKVKGVCYLKHSYIHIDLQVLAESEDELFQEIEDFVWKFASVDNPYECIEFEITERAADKRIRAYIDSYQEKSMNKIFEELEKRFEKEDAQENSKIQENKIDTESEEETYDFPTRFSPEMISYIKELRKVSEYFDYIDDRESFFSRTLIISMDDGWGYSAFLRNIRDELLHFYSSKIKVSDIKILESSLSPSSEEVDVVSVWSKQVEMIKELSERQKKEKKFAIVSYDMTPWLKYLDNPGFINQMRKIGQYSKHVLLVLRIPYMDANVIRKMERNLSEVLSIRSIVVPPVSTENMVTYFKGKLREAHFLMKSDCTELVEQWICQEKNAGNFFGYKSLDKMVGELIYNKALNGETKGLKTAIHREDVQRMLQDEVILEENAYEVLDSLIGIAQVKQRIREIVAQIKVQKMLQEQGKDIDKPTIHMMFTGNPGTGKTTVARILGQIFKEEGILRKGQFYEVHGRDLIGKHVGHTAPKTQGYCRDAYGSVLFIDEAYSITADESKWDFGHEAMSVLIAEMENHRDDLCVIVAGYTDEMNEFIKSNPGLESRIPHVVEFPNYTKDELIQIFYKIVDGKFECEEALKETFEEYIYNIPNEVFEAKEFSNARFIRNIYERLWGKAAYRCSLTGEKEIILKKEDMISFMETDKLAEVIEEKPKRRIGFEGI